MFNKKELTSLLAWSFFSCGVIRCLVTLYHAVANDTVYFFMVLGTYSLLAALIYVIFKMQFGNALKYGRYLLAYVLFGVFLTAFMYIRHQLVMLPGDVFHFVFYLVLFVCNLFLSSLLYLFTLIKLRAI